MQTGDQIIRRVRVAFAGQCTMGCKSGVHKSWFISDFDTKEEALQIVPPFLRHNANIIELVTFTKEDIANFANE